ncbi:MAG TPA: hypothetical protein VD963_02450 [Phycisphaerales bacterium]|nr:hypothetical protein [Phycisphaerales bacterium]
MNDGILAVIARNGQLATYDAGVRAEIAAIVRSCYGEAGPPVEPLGHGVLYLSVTSLKSVNDRLDPALFTIMYPEGANVTNGFTLQTNGNVPVGISQPH